MHRLHAARPPLHRSVLPRRPVLLGLAAMVAAPGLAGSLAGCAEQPPDPLVALLTQARSDVALIEAAAAGLRGGRGGPAGAADTLSALTAARRAHADALAAELGEDAPAAATEPPRPPAADPTAALAGVRAALDQARERAAAEVPGASRHRAALVGSIAACCAAYRSVLA